jgi:predicted enzyme related to lactoylglutathione lyase
MGKVVHFEIPADDMDRAHKFYKEVFGWKIQEMPEFNYTIVRTGPSDEKGMPTEPGYIGGGMMKRRQIRTPVITIDVKDIENSLKDVKSHGGKVLVEKQEVGTMGYTAYFQDSEGNILGLWQTRTQ